MRLSHFAAAIAVAFLTGSCASPAGDVNVLQSANTITPGATLAWAPLATNELQNGDPRIDNDIIRGRIRTAIESAFTAKGYTFSQDPNAAQYLVSYHIGLQDRQEIRSNAAVAPGAVCGWRGCVRGYGWGMYGAPNEIRTNNYVEGTLMIDLADRTSGQLEWRATSLRRVDQDDATQERLNAAIADTIKSLPGEARAS